MRMFHVGSLFIIAYTRVHQVAIISSTSGSTRVLITCIGTPQLSADETIVITSDGITVADQDVGVPRKALSGSFTVVTYGEFAQSTALGDSSIAIDLASAATLTAFSTNYTPRLKVTRYRYTDMSTKNALWQESTKEPTASFANDIHPELFFNADILPDLRTALTTLLAATGSVLMLSIAARSSLTTVGCSSFFSNVSKRAYISGLPDFSMSMPLLDIYTITVRVRVDRSPIR